MNDFTISSHRAQFSPESTRRPSSPSSQTCPLPPKNIAEWERFASLASGAGLALFGLIRGRGTGLACFGLGGALLYRGLTGHCHLYSALGLSTTPHTSGSVIPAQTGALQQPKQGLESTDAGTPQPGTPRPEVQPS